MLQSSELLLAAPAQGGSTPAIGPTGPELCWPHRSIRSEAPSNFLIPEPARAPRALSQRRPCGPDRSEAPRGGVFLRVTGAQSDPCPAQDRLGPSRPRQSRNKASHPCSFTTNAPSSITSTSYLLPWAPLLHPACFPGAHSGILLVAREGPSRYLLGLALFL